MVHNRIPSRHNIMSIDAAARRKEKFQFLLSENNDCFDDESSYSSYSDSDDSDASSLDSIEWDMEMEQLEAGVNSLLGSAKSKPFSTLLLTKNTVARAAPHVLESPELEDVTDEMSVVSNDDNAAEMNPVHCLMMLLHELDVPMDIILPSNDCYLSIEKEHLEAYSQLAPAARQGDLETIKNIHKTGACLQSCNDHGESIVHIVCRRGYRNILQFLLEEGNVSLRIRDDVGRTPLHDAAWTSSPNFELIQMILMICPDFLLVKDNRGHLPLAYVPREQWGAWCSFLNMNQHLIQAALESKFIEIRE